MKSCIDSFERIHTSNYGACNTLLPTSDSPRLLPQSHRKSLIFTFVNTSHGGTFVRPLRYGNKARVHASAHALASSLSIRHNQERASHLTAAR